MRKVARIPLFGIDELDPRSRETARDWYRHTVLSNDWYDYIFEDFERICETLGIALARKTVRLMGGGSRPEPRITFSGFSSQGDGASFEGEYRYARTAARAIREQAPLATDLHAIADRLQKSQRRNFYRPCATITRSGRYCHEYSMDVAVSRDGLDAREANRADEDSVIEAMRDLARWLYRSLEREHDFQTSAEQVDEAIRAGAYSFNRQGQRFG